ncbi:hypothetical protein N7509_009640 [Penicillium cosmopolitanum]|uniref:NACHT domain-containing protein n=1 Tax=Penicillium cosmopolitanum TaxID=1131564 RepID=A0A9W9VPY7_9EURO|nr:uncharacterized protein N7509_009640 [Penicillium cosmopolitanum]KAJ5387099.1 hypothetical protein N7509_009640 [Penicillium cosmopolitanum]
MDYDKLSIAHGAELGSYMDRHEDECLSGTRTELLEEIAQWAESPQGKLIFWLNGMAGTGKSTISRTVAKSLKNDKLLGASFFFKRGEGDRGNAMKFFPTITEQLVRRLPEMMLSIQKVIHEDPRISENSPMDQFDKLLLRPLLELRLSGHAIPPIVIVIDALDECEGDKDIRLIVQLLSQLHRPTAVRIRLFLTSRPELPIRLGFSEIANNVYQDLALHEIPERVTEHDIDLFLRDRFAKIGHDRKVSRNWPSDGIIQALVKMAVPLFISAATVCLQIEKSRLEPVMHLEKLLEDQSRYVTRMDKTYLPILMRFVDDQNHHDWEQEQLLREFQDIVGIIIILAVPLSINTLSQFIGTGKDIINNLLDSFQSVLSVPDDHDRPVRTLHLSFRDFLLNTTSIFRVEKSKKHSEICAYCLKTMQRHLKNNICNLDNPGTSRAEIDPQSIRQCLPEELQYSCRFWAYHLTQGKESLNRMGEVFSFLQKHFLHWLEAMILLGLMSDVVETLNVLQTVISGDSHPAICDFLRDARRFVLKNRQITDEVPLQLYYSGLLFTPLTAIIRREFKKDFPTFIEQLTQIEKRWSPELQALEGHSSAVISVNFSPDSQLLASGSDDKTIRLWNMATGTLQQTLQGHSDGVTTVAFSPDCQVLASGSFDSTIRLWDTLTGTLQQTLRAHSDLISSVTFSPNGRLLASASFDTTVRLWDTITGALEYTINAHSYWVRWAAFSPDSRLLASGSEDLTICLWNIVTGTLQDTLKGHSRPVRSVAFSPDGQLLASGSEDKTICLWDIATGTLRNTLKCYSSLVRSVVFSPSGQILASGFDDKTVRLWNTTTGIPEYTFKGHSGPVTSVAFSPDGQLLASGSDDKTIRLWDMATGNSQQSTEDHYSHSVNSVAFSPDSQLLASGSFDMKVRLWDTATGCLLLSLKGHSHKVSSVAFSPDGQLLASGSFDRTVRLWDTKTGVLRHTLKIHSVWVLSVAFSPDGWLLASGSEDRTICLWDIVTGTLQDTLKGHSRPVRSVAFSPNGRLLASGSVDATVRLWDTATGTLKNTLRGHSDSVTSVAFSPDGQLLASGSDDKTVRFWDTATGTLQRASNVEDGFTSLEFSEDGSYLKTNLGPLDIQFMCGGHPSNTPHMNLSIFIKQRQWITLNGKRLLWLPNEARPTCSAVDGGMLALGHVSGRISFIRVHLASSKHEKIVRTQLNEGDNVNVQGGAHENALHAASLKGSEKVVQVLLDRGANVDTQGGQYGSALQAASFRGHEKVVQMLLDRGANVDTQGGQYGSALQAASFRGHEKVVQMLLDRGANVDTQGGQYSSALQAASFRGHEKVVQMLRDRGANVDTQVGQYGNTLQVAFSGGHNESERTLLWRDTYEAMAEQRDRQTYQPGKPRDIFEAFSILQRCGRQRLPKHIISLILDFARYWLLSKVTRKDLISIVARDCKDKPPYLTSEPIQSFNTHVREIKVIIWSHDQGFSSYPEDHGTFKNSWTWFELEIERPPKSLRFEDPVATNMHACKEFQCHMKVFSGEGSDEANGLIKTLQTGDRVSIIPMARFPGWRNYVREASIEVYSTCLR